MNRNAPAVEKEEVDNFYGIDTNDLYDEVSQDINEKDIKVNHSIECMEKYNNDKWNEFFYDFIAGKIRLYEDKLCKNVKRDSTFRNPFLLEDNENFEKIENNDNDTGEEDILKKEVKKARRRNSKEVLPEELSLDDILGKKNKNENGGVVRMSMMNKGFVDEVDNGSDSNSNSNSDKSEEEEEEKKNDDNENNIVNNDVNNNNLDGENKNNEIYSDNNFIENKNTDIDENILKN